MLHNITKNRKCHHHLATQDFVNFLVGMFNSQFYSKHESTAAATAHRATIKNIMHVLTLMDHQTMYGRDVAVDSNIATIIRSLQEQSFMNSSQATSSSLTLSESDPTEDVGELKSVSRQNSREAAAAAPKKPRITLSTRKLSVNSNQGELFL